MTSSRSERGVALVFALATLTLVAITIAAVAGEVQSRAAGVVLEERAVRVIALSDAAMAETLAELAANGAAFRGVTERWVEGGTITLGWIGLFSIEPIISKIAETITITFTGSGSGTEGKFAFTGYVTDYSISGDAEEAYTGTITCKVASGITWTDAA